MKEVDPGTDQIQRRTQKEREMIEQCHLKEREVIGQGHLKEEEVIGRDHWKGKQMIGQGHLKEKKETDIRQTFKRGRKLKERDPDQSQVTQKVRKSINRMTEKEQDQKTESGNTETLAQANSCVLL